MNYSIIDTHAHYDNKRFNKDRDDIIAALPEKGVERVINVGCDMKTSKESLKLAEKYPFVYATVGVHPHYANTLSEEHLPILESLCESKKVVAFGEIGLDFFHNFSPPYTQRYWFKAQLELASKLGLPIVIHSRDAHDETFAFVEASGVRSGVVHAFSGDASLAFEYVDLGFHVGIGGVITFGKTDTLKKAVAEIPLERVLLETDCPYLAPAPHRGQRNESSYLTFVAEEIAKIKGITMEEVCAITTENAKRLFLQ